MENLEKQLKRAMTQKDPPPGFSAKVLARIEAKREARWSRWQMILLPARNAALAGGLACMMIAGVATAYHQHQVQERRRAEEARDQLMVALRITSTQLHRVNRVLAPNVVER
jgi:hypothetical protein